MGVEVLSGFPKKGFKKFLISNGVGIAIILILMAIPRIFFGNILFSEWGTFLYVSVSFVCSVIIAIICSCSSLIIRYGYYKRTGLVWAQFLIIIVSFIILVLLTVLFWKNTFADVSNDYELDLRRLSQFNVLLVLNPFIVPFITASASLFETLYNSCPDCKILETLEEERAEIVSCEVKRHTHKEKGHYETDTTEIIDPHVGACGTTAYVAKTTRWVEGEVVDDGLFEHKTTKHHMVCKNCGNRLDRTYKSEKKIGD